MEQPLLGAAPPRAALQVQPGPPSSLGFLGGGLGQPASLLTFRPLPPARGRALPLLPSRHPCSGGMRQRCPALSTSRGVESVALGAGRRRVLP